MNSENYVEREWERRFQIHQRPPAVERFAMGFMMGAAITGALFFWLNAASAGTF